MLLGSVAACPQVGAQQSVIPLIGYLSSETPDSDVGRIAGVRAGLAEAGYVEGKNITIESRWAGNQVDRLPGLVADLIRHQVLVIAASGVFSAFAAKATTHTVPIVFTVASDPVELGLVASLNRPGGNLTGVNSIAGEVAGKGLEVLHELLPSTSSVALPCKSE